MMMRGGAATAIAMALTAVPAFAQSVEQYQIAEQDLASALKAFAVISGREVIAPSEIVTGKRSRPVSDAATAEQALRELLEGTGLRFEVVGGAFIIRVADEVVSDEPSSQGAPIVVTGSRIRGAPIASPVITLSRDAIRDAGQSDLGDVARNLPQSFGGGQNPGVGFNVPTAVGGNVGGGSSFNLRGLGSDATLTLLNGRRMPYSASRQSIDVSAIPLAAVDRVEVVADGASALYGSDAVAGVVNVILQHDFEGVETRARLGAATEGGHLQQQYSFTGGTQWRSGGVVATYEFGRTTAITAEDRDYASDRPGVTLLPGMRRHGIVVSGHQDLKERLSFEFDALYNRRRGSNIYPLNFDGDLTVSRTEQSFAADTYALAGSAALSLGAWRATLTGTFGEDETDFRGDTYFDNELSLVQQGTYGNQSASAELGADGTLVQLPGGPAKLALGAGIRANDFRSFIEGCFDYSLGFRNSAGSTAARDAAIFSSTCSGREAPMIAEATLGSRSTHASGNCAKSETGLVGERLEALNCLQHSGLHQAFHKAAQLIAGRARTLRRRRLGGVLTGKYSLSERRPDDL